MKYALCLDYKASAKKGLVYATMEAKNELEAIAEADAKWSDEIYMMQIMKKTDKTERKNGWRIEKYSAILARRSYGWHLNNKENCEAEHNVRHYIPKNPEHHWFETI